jgi:hypothetical protein
MSSLDFTTAQLKHSRWKNHLRAYLDGKEQVNDAELVSPKDCELGKWLYAEGLSKYKQIHEMSELEKVHGEMHSRVKTLVQKKRAGDAIGAEQEYKSVTANSDRVVGLLTEIKKKID